MAGRLTVGASGCFALVVALHAERIFSLVEAASAFGTAGVLVTTMINLSSGRGGAKSAGAALLVGLVCPPLAVHWLHLPAPFLTSILAAVVSYVIVTAMLERNAEASRYS